MYESLTLPLAIILIVPMCILSALLGVWLTGGDNNIFTQIGLIVLVGLSAKNAILIVEFARELEMQGRSIVEAAIEASRLRLRPILMTSIAFIMGVVPLVMSTGAGSEMRHAMGIAVFFGMLGVTLFGLILTPVFYVLLRKLARTEHITDKHGTHPQMRGINAFVRSAVRDNDEQVVIETMAGVVGPRGRDAGRRGLLARPDLREAPTWTRRPRSRKRRSQRRTRRQISPAEAGTWKTAQPSEEVMRGEWWTIFDDATLNDLEQQAADANQNLKAAAARVKEARAINQTARAGLFPTIDAGFGPTREKLSAASQFQPDGTNVPAQTLWRAQASVSYEVDLFGRVAIDRRMPRRPTRSRARRCSARCSSRCRRTSRRTTSTCANSTARWMCSRAP